MAVLAVPRRDHALAGLKSGIDPLWRRVVEWVREIGDYRTGLVHRHISMRGLAAELRATVEAVKAAVRRAKRRGLIAVWKRGPLGMPYFALVTPDRPLCEGAPSPVAEAPPALREPAPTPEPPPLPASAPAKPKGWGERFLDRIKGIVPFTSGRGPEPTVMPRPFDAPRGDGYVRQEDLSDESGPGCATGMSLFAPKKGFACDERANCEMGVRHDPERHAQGQHVGGLPEGAREASWGPVAADPARGGEAETHASWYDLPDEQLHPDARQIKTFATRKEALESSIFAPPTGAEGPHGELRQLFLHLHHALGGNYLMWTSTDDWSIQRLLRCFGLDKARALIRRELSRPRVDLLQLSIQQIAWRYCAEPEREQRIHEQR